jgi:hypothetical protein
MLKAVIAQLATKFGSNTVYPPLNLIRYQLYFLFAFINLLEECLKLLSFNTESLVLKFSGVFITVVLLLLLLAFFFSSCQLLFVIVLNLHKVQNIGILFVGHPKAFVLFFFQTDLI